MDSAKYCDNAPMVYGIKQFVQSGYTLTDYRSLGKHLQTMMKNYPNIAFYLVYSTTKKNIRCKREVVKTGCVGRPRHIIHGKKVLPHVHCLYIDLSPELTIQKVELEIIDHLQELHARDNTIRRYSARPFDNEKPPFLHAGNYFRYCREQADNECIGGATHDWNYYKSELWHN